MTPPAKSTAWTRFRTTPIGELITGTAHEAHPADITLSLGERFAGRTILALHVALEKAATVRVAFNSAGRPQVSEIRNIRQRSSSELGDVLRTEAAACGASWVVVVLATGWQATLGHRAARPEHGERASKYSRYRLMLETPEAVVPKAQVDRVYTAVDHPVLDKSVVFSVRRRELDDLFTEIRRAGLGIASVRIAIAAQLEQWLATEGEQGLRRDLLICDGLSALLLNTEQGDFVLPRGAVEAEQPRQAVQRPSTIEEDIARFVGANGGRPVTYVGPEELATAVRKRASGVDIERRNGHAAHDLQVVAVDGSVRHDLYFEAQEVRPPLPKAWRRITLGLAAVLSLLLATTAVNVTYALRVGYQAYDLRRSIARNDAEANSSAVAMAKFTSEIAQAAALRAWVASNYHAQRFCQRLLRDIPANAALDRMAVDFKDGQIALTFVVLGDQDGQLAAHRMIERGINDLRYKIGGEEAPVAASGASRAIQYRMHIIVPESTEVSAP